MDFTIEQLKKIAQKLASLPTKIKKRPIKYPKIFSIRFSKAELEAVKKIALKNKITISELVRERSLADESEWDKSLLEVKEIGNNINKIAKICNADSKYTQQNREELLQQIEKIKMVLTNLNRAPN